jgi:multiple sugar transport system substrate-binding protein
MVATATAYARSHPDVRIEWQTRSLQDFADSPLDALAERYDLIVFDYPFAGIVARERCFEPLDKQLPAYVLRRLEAESVGPSHLSYYYDGHQWALAIDAAAQVAGYRPDLLRSVDADVPTTWEEVCELQQVRRGFVTLPLLPVDALMSFFTLCASLGEPAFSADKGKVVSEDIGDQALRLLKQLADGSSPEALEWNPIAVWERMGTADEIGYCPLGFGYSNYARSGYRKHLISYTNIPSSRAGGPVGSVLGGAGLAISVRCRELSTALDYVQWVASADCQRSLYVRSGGQPANKRAWTDPEVNRMTNRFFESTMETLERAYLRPRFPGFVDLQKAASSAMSDFLKAKRNAGSTIRLINNMLHASL